jgi:hypothetical protein
MPALAAIHLRILREPDEVTPEDIVTICLARVGQHSFLDSDDPDERNTVYNAVRARLVELQRDILRLCPACELCCHMRAPCLRCCSVRSQ